MPGVYSKDKFDLAGFSVGIVSKNIKQFKVKNKDIILAIPSSGIHSNGYSLTRALLKNYKLNIKLGKILMQPTKIYSNEIIKLTEKNLLHSAAHIRWINRKFIEICTRKFIYKY